MKTILFCLMFLCSLSHAETGAYALYDYNSANYVVEYNRREVRSIASITKLFTAVTILNSGVNLNETVKINGRSRGHVPQGAYMTRLDLMRAMLISSDNRAAETLANHHPGGFNKFIFDANLYLENNALYNTRLVDSTGLLPGNTSTAMDLIEFLNQIKSNDTIRSIANERNAVVHAPSGKRTITIALRNTNPEIFVYDNILISKTGFTNPAGRCVLMLIEKHNELYAVVVLGQRNVKERSKLVKDLFKVEVEPLLFPKINTTIDFLYINPRYEARSK